MSALWTDIELAIGNGGALSSDDNEEDDETVDEDYIDGLLTGDYEETSSDEGSDADDDYDEDQITDGAELAEAERMAMAADLSEGGDDPHLRAAEDDAEATGYTLAIDRKSVIDHYDISHSHIPPATSASTSRIYIVDGQGRHQDIELGTEDNGPGISSDTLSILSRLLGRRSLRPAVANRRDMQVVSNMDDDDDDDEDNGIGMFQYGFRGGRRTAEGLFPRQITPMEAGVDLERRGLFGKVKDNSCCVTNGRRLIDVRMQPSSKYGTSHKKRLYPYARNINEILRLREYKQRTLLTQRYNIGDHCVPNSPGTEVAKGDANIYCGQYSQDGSFFYTCAQGEHRAKSIPSYTGVLTNLPRFQDSYI